MQANNDPKWTDDAAFWNEAWADMDKRLDQQQPSRMAAVIWWHRYGWLLGLLVLVVAVATPTAMTYLSQDKKTEQKVISPLAPATPASTAPAVVADNDNKSPAQEIRSTDRTSDEIIVVNNGSENGGVSGTSTKSVGASTPNSTSKQAPLAAIPFDNEDTDIEQASSTPSLTTTSPEYGPGIAVLDMPTTAQLERQIPAALTSLADQPIGTIEFAQRLRTDQVAVAIKQPKLASRLHLDAGVSNGLQGNNTGYYAGLQYTPPISKRFSIPVGVRFRKDFHNFKGLAESGTPARFLESSDISTGATAPDTIQVIFSEDNIDDIVTTALEGRIGLTYSPAPRWQIGTSVSLNYLNTAKARISSQYQAEFAADQGNSHVLDADFVLVNRFNSSNEDAAFASPGTPITLGTNSQSGIPEFNKWITYAGLHLSYDLTRQLTLTMAGRQLLGQPDQSKVIGLQRGQLEIGARFRLK